VNPRVVLVLEKYPYMLYFKWYDIMITTISVIDMLLFTKFTYVAMLSKLIVKPENLTTEKHDGWIKQIRLTLHNNCGVNIK